MFFVSDSTVITCEFLNFFVKYNVECASSSVLTTNDKYRVFECLDIGSVNIEILSALILAV